MQKIFFKEFVRSNFEKIKNWDRIIVRKNFKKKINSSEIVEGSIQTVF
jgi:hypothetical protein